MADRKADEINSILALQKNRMIVKEKGKNLKLKCQAADEFCSVENRMWNGALRQDQNKLATKAS